MLHSSTYRRACVVLVLLLRPALADEGPPIPVRLLPPPESPGSQMTPASPFRWRTSQPAAPTNPQQSPATSPSLRRLPDPQPANEPPNTAGLYSLARLPAPSDPAPPPTQVVPKEESPFELGRMPLWVAQTEDVHAPTRGAHTDSPHADIPTMTADTATPQPLSAAEPIVLAPQRSSISTGQEPTVATLPPDRPYPAWWDGLVSHPAGNRGGARSLTIDHLIASALQHSSEVRVISETPLIKDTAIIEAAAAFDWAAFMEASWADIDEPVGSTLTTGGPGRFSNQLMQYELGLRRQLSTGGRFEVGQRYGWERSNSVFFLPNDQGTSRLTLNFTQPLLRGAGQVYNNSLILIAQIESGIARDDFTRELQGYLLDVTRAYWSLYLERAELLQRSRLFQRGQVILEKLEARQTTDAVTSQVVRARSAVASRRSDLFDARAAVKNAEGRIRALVNDPNLGCLDELELTPVDLPTTLEVPLSLPDVIESAMKHRPEVHAAIKRVKAASVRMNLTKNELLPALDLVLETYVAGLRGEDAIGDAWTDQFSAGAPSYSAGLQFEIPLQNRQAKARFQRRALELKQLQARFDSDLAALQLEVEIAVREVQTTYQEVKAKYEAMQASAGEVQFIEERWSFLPGDDRSAALYLEDLLSAQERLANAEFEFADAQVNYNLALSDLKRANGTLLQCEQIEVHRVEDGGIPSLILTKQPTVEDDAAWAHDRAMRPVDGQATPAIVPQAVPDNRASGWPQPSGLPAIENAAATAPNVAVAPQNWQEVAQPPAADSEPFFAPY